MTHITRRLTAKNRDQLWNPTLGNRVWATFYLYITDSKLFQTKDADNLVVVLCPSGERLEQDATHDLTLERQSPEQARQRLRVARVGLGRVQPRLLPRRRRRVGRLLEVLEPPVYL